MMSCGHVPSLSYSQATGRISLTAKSCAISRRFFCSSVSVKSTMFSGDLLMGCAGRATAKMIDWSVNPAGRVAKAWRSGNNHVCRTSVFGRERFPSRGLSVLAMLVGAVARLTCSARRQHSYDHIGDGGFSGEGESLRGRARRAGADSIPPPTRGAGAGNPADAARPQRAIGTAAASQRWTSTLRSPDCSRRQQSRPRCGAYRARCASS